jgi:hypothetical protein
MDEMVLLPTEGVAEAVTRPDTNPWLDTEGRWIGRWMRTVGMALFSPVRLMKGTPVGASTAKAVRFCTLTSLGIVVLGGAVAVAMFALPMMARGTAGTGVFVAITGLAWGVLVLFLAVSAIVIVALVWGLLAHALLRLTGPTHAGPARTVQAFLYASAGNAPTAVPCVGVYLMPLGLLWWWGSAAAMLVEGQKVRAWRAIVASSVVPVLSLILIVATAGFAYVQASQGVASARATVATYPWHIPPRDAFDLLLGHARAHGGRGPDHAARVLLNYTHDPARPVQWSATFPTMLPELRALPPSVREARLEQLADEVGAGTDRPAAAHRVDDLVFMYTGVDLLNPQDPNLWVIVQCPDPEAGRTFQPDTTVVVVCADGSVTRYDDRDFGAALERQNGLRRSLGVPEAPDPRHVLHVRPKSP